MQQGIYGFFGPYRFLSNFAFVNVELDGEVYSSTEHAYQAAKSLDPEARAQIQRMTSPSDAKKLGKLIRIRPDWDDVKWSVMYDLSCQKYAQAPFTQQLLDTHPLHLEETNTWGDRYWGVCRGSGQNQLGRILMSIRSTLIEIANDQN